MNKRLSYFNSIIFLLFHFILSQNLYAAYSIGYGYEPKYKDDFEVFDYANPNAVKGGELNLASLSTSFDSLNPFLLKGNSASGIEQLIFETTGSAVNHIDITNAATGSGPQIGAVGGDTNISLKLRPKATGSCENLVSPSPANSRMAFSISV